MFPQTSPIISSSVAGAMEQVLQQPSDMATGQGEAGKEASQDLALLSRTALCTVGKEALQTLAVPEGSQAGWVLEGAVWATNLSQNPQEAADGENVDFVCSQCWNPNLPSS